MAELLVRLFDKYQGADPLIISKSTGRGDVIVVAEDGWNWSTIERHSYNWMIVKTPTPIAKCRTMRASEPGNPLVNPYLRILAFYFNLETLTVSGFPIPSDASARTARSLGQSRPIESVVIPEAVFDAVRTAKTAIPDPAVIG